VIAIQNLEIGQKLGLKGGVIAEVAENPRDGSWLVVRHLDPSGGQPPGSPELCHADDVEEIL